MTVELRLLRPEDAAISVTWRNDPLVWTYTLAAGRPPVELATERAWIEKVIADPTGRRFAILCDCQYVGNVYLTDIDAGSAQYHIFIGDRGMWGRGIARAATVSVLDLAWHELSLEQVYLLVHPDNLMAKGLYERLGFTLTGVSDCFDIMTIFKDSCRKYRGDHESS